MLPANQRLQRNQDFRRVYKRGREYVHPLAVLYVMRRTGEEAVQIPGRRVGFVVSKKQGNAVVRNRIKRRLREAMRLQLHQVKPGAYDLVFVGRGRLKTAAWTEIQEAVGVLLKRAGMLEEAKAENGAS